MTIKRYEVDECGGFYEDREGDYMLYADHVAEVAALKARIAELESERDDLQAELYEATNGD